MTDFERIAAHFNQSAKCRRRKDSRPRVEYEPGCLHIGCEHPSCACAMNSHGDEPLSVTLAKWQELHG